MRRFSQLLLAWFACLHLCGGPLGMMQVVAWSGMLVKYSQECGVGGGVKRTFDGRHPCRLCRAVVETREQDSPAPAPGKLPPSGGLTLIKDFAWSGGGVCPVCVVVEGVGLTGVEPGLFAPLVVLAPAVPPPRFVG